MKFTLSGSRIILRPTPFDEICKRLTDRPRGRDDDKATYKPFVIARRVIGRKASG